MKAIITRGAFFLFLCAAVAAAWLAGCSQQKPPGAEGQKRVIARINSYEITAEDFKDELVTRAMVNSGVPAEKLKQDVLENMIIRQLLLEEAQKQNFDKGKEFLKEIENYWRQTLLKLFLNKKSKELQLAVKVSEDEIAREYERLSRKLQVQMVVLKDKEAAQELSGAGADFEAKLAGLSGKIIRQPEAEWWMAGELPYGIENLVFSLKPAEATQPFMTGGQWTVARLIAEEKVETRPLNKMRGKIKEMVLKRKREQEMERWLAGLKSRSDIRRYPSELEKIEVLLKMPKSGGTHGE